MPAMPEVPTYSEQGLKGYESGNYVALFAPTGVSAEFVARLNQAVGQAVRSADFSKKLAALGITASHSSPGELAAQVRDTDQSLAGMVKAADYKMP